MRLPFCSEVSGGQSAELPLPQMQEKNKEALAEVFGRRFDEI